MRKGLKKMSALLLLSVVLVLSGCTSRVYVENEALYQARSNQYVEMLVGTDTATLEAELENLEAHYEDFEQQIALYPYIGGTGQKFDFTAEAYVSMLTSYLDNVEDFGAYVGVKEYEGATEDSDGNITYSVVYKFESHDMRMSLEYNSDDVITTVTLDPIYSTGEIAQKAVLNTLIGMSSVFVVLGILTFLISCFQYIHRAEERATKNKKAATKKSPEAPAPVSAAPAQPAADPQLVAVITAAVAATMGTSADGFIVRSIKRRSTNKWKNL